MCQTFYISCWNTEHLSCNYRTNTERCQLEPTQESRPAQHRCGLVIELTEVAYIGALSLNPPMLWRGAILVTDTTVAESTRRWGAFTSTAEVPADGHYFELDEAGVLSVVTVKGDAVVVSIPSGSFNGDVKARSYAVDTNVHAYEILYYTMGAWFFIDDVLIHGYDAVDDRIVWDIVQENLPALHRQVVALLGEDKDIE